MELEILDKKKFVMTFENEVETLDVQSLIDYAKYLDATAKSQAKQSDVDALADEVSRGWWNNNKNRFIKCE